MFDVHVDLHLEFTPLFCEDDPMILTRSIQLPFAPAEGIAIAIQADPDVVDCRSRRLKNVIYDLATDSFLASMLVAHDASVTVIPMIIADCVNDGWRIGPYLKAEDQLISDKTPPEPQRPVPLIHEDDDQAVLENGVLRPQTAFEVETFGTIARTLVELNNWSPLAYGMDKVGAFCLPTSRYSKKSTWAAKWATALRQYDGLSADEHEKWVHEIRTKYFSMGHLISNIKWKQ